MILKNAKIVLHDKVIDNGYLIIEHGKIKEIGEKYQGDGIDLKSAYLMPGFIDLHIHGRSGYDVIEGTSDAINTIIKDLPSEGTTGFLATTLTVPQNEINNAIINTINYDKSVKGAKVYGIHLEGPFINEKFKGAQNAEFIVNASIEKIDNWQKIGKNGIKQVTYAIEKTTTDFTKYLFENKIIASVGHSEATFSDVISHVDCGLSHITHFHNGQSGHHHRNPGIVTAGFYSDKLNTEIICDGIHIHPDVIKTIFKVKGRDNIIMITDSMAAKGMPDGLYKLGGLEVIKSGSEVRLADGALAGSCLEMNIAVKNFLTFTNATISDVSVMTSRNQAIALGIDNEVGYIKEEYIADLTVLNEEFEVIMTLVNGEIVYKRYNN